MTEETPRLLLISAHNLVRLLFKSGVYSRVISTAWVRTCSGAATIREWRLFESGIYLVIYGRNFGHTH